MKIKKEYYILFAIILVLSIYLLLRNRDRTHYQLPKLPDVARAEISKIEISKPEVSIVLNKKDNRWHIAPKGYTADDNKVESMLDIIEKLTLTALVSESKNYDRYSLNDDKKIIVKAWTGETMGREFEVGKAATSYKHTFVKLVGDDRVYHARGNFRGKFEQTVDTLQDKSVLSFDKAQIQEIHITKGDKSIVLGRKQVPVEVKAGKESEPESPPPSPKEENVWQSSDGKEGDESKLNRLLSTLSNLLCEKYIDNRKKDDFKEPIYTLKLKGAQDYTLSIFPKTDKNAKTYPAISSENDFPFLLPDSKTNSIMTNPDELLKKPGPDKSEKGQEKTD